VNSTDPSRLDDPWRTVRALREDVRELRAHLDGALDRIAALERPAPQAQQAQYEAGAVAAGHPRRPGERASALAQRMTGGRRRSLPPGGSQ